jgi:radical SAM enzyme (TIGR01210 family)
VEEECAANGETVSVATIFLTNRECPWRCVMCDLWQNTLTETLASGAIPKQIDHALAQLPPARQVKLYNSGSFFDNRAIPIADYPAIAARVGSFERVVVECHPNLVSDRCLEFRDLVHCQLEVAMGLETVHPQVLDRLNKQMSLEQFATAAAFLQSNSIDLRVFILVQPPFLKSEESLHWAQRSLDFAFDCGATAATLIPTRGGNGAMEVLSASGEFSPPSLATVEAAADYGLGLSRGRVFVDLWNLHSATHPCPCYSARIARLHRMNLHQQLVEAVECHRCGARS